MISKFSPAHGVSYMKMEDEEGHILITGGTGISAKTMCTNFIVQQLHRKGRTVIHLTNVKDHKLEAGAVAFTPTILYHRQLMIKYGIQERSFSIKKYHVVCDSIPKRNISETKFYTIPIKQINDVLIRFLLNNPSSENSVDTIKYVIKKLRPEDGLPEFFYKLGREVLQSSKNIDNDIFILNKNSNFLNIKKAERFDIKIIDRAFSIFQNEGIILTPLNYKHNLDFTELLNDNKHYHIFFDIYTEDEKFRFFRTLYILEQIYKHLPYCKKKLVIVMEEITYIFRSGEEGWRAVLNARAAELISKIRSMGSGVLIIGTTQVWSRLDRNVLNIFSKPLLGKTNSPGDIKLIANTYGAEIANAVVGLDRGYFIYITSNPKTKKIMGKKVLIPVTSHAHPESGFNFEQQWKKKFPKRMKKYTNILKEVRRDYNECIKSVEYKVKVEMNKISHERQLAADIKDTNIVQKSTEREEAEKLGGIIRKTKDETRNIAILKCLNMYEKDKRIVFYRIARELGVQSQTVKRWYEEYLKRIAEESNKAPTEEDKKIKDIDDKMFYQEVK